MQTKMASFNQSANVPGDESCDQQTQADSHDLPTQNAFGVGIVQARNNGDSQGKLPAPTQGEMAFGGGGIGGGGLDGGAFGGGAFGGGGAAFGGGRFGAAKKPNHESNMSSALVSAAMRGDEIEVLKQLDAGVSIEEVDKQTVRNNLSFLNVVLNSC